MDDIRGWFREGVAKGRTHMVIVCDTFSHDDHPEYFDNADDVRKREAGLGSMERVMEVYHLLSPMEEQVTQRRCFNYGPASPATKEPTMADERDDQKKPTIHELEAILDSDQPLRVVVAPDGQVRTEPRVSVAEAIYGTLWRSGDLNMPYELARKYALEAIGGKGSEAQRRAIDWACTNFPPPDDIDVWQIDDAFGAALERAKEQTP